MPRKRVRTTSRGNWSENDLLDAVKLIKEDKIAIREAARQTGVPERTIRRRLATNNFTKAGCGPQSYLGDETEKKLVAHIKQLQLSGFSPTPSDVRLLAFNLASEMNLPNKFNLENGRAGRDWFRSFMERNSTLSIRKAENLSVARATGMNRTDVDSYFVLLEKAMTDLNILNKPSAIYNLDESGLQLNNEGGKVVAMKGSKDVHHISSTERGESITVVSCCNAEGNFLPPFCIFKGKNKKNEWQDLMPPGSDIRMSPKSSYINSELFLIWLQEHFIPRKTPGKVILLLDGHSSHMSVPALQLAFENDITFICFPSHTTHFLQPLDRSFFKPLKHYFKEACNTWMLNHFRCNEAEKKKQLKTTARKIGRMQFGELLSKAWGQAATCQNAVSGFKATGVVPLDKNAIPDHAFITQINHSVESGSTENVTQMEEDLNDGTHNSQFSEDPLEGTSTQYPNHNNTPTKIGNKVIVGLVSSPEKSTYTPSKMISKISPIPVFQKPSNTNKRKQRAEIISSKEFIQKKKEDYEKRQKKIEDKKQRKEKKLCKKNVPFKGGKTSFKNLRLKKKLIYDDTSSESGGSMVLMDSDDSMSMGEFDDSYCAECLERYEDTKSVSDWIKCITCGRWIHETCSIYSFNGKCGDCGRREIRQEKLTNKKLKK